MSDLQRTAGWQTFLKNARYVRNDPRFTIEERYWKLEVARSVRLVLEKAEAGEEWVAFLDAVLLRHGYRYYFPFDYQCEWLKAWALADRESLRQALARFVDPELSIRARFRQFVKAAKAGPDARVATEAGSILAFGSLFNFAHSPHTLPLVRAEPFDRLKSLLGYEPSPPNRTKQYEHHLRFACQVQELLADEPLLAEDMLDVQGLIFAASRPYHETWPYAEEDREKENIRREVHEHFIRKTEREDAEPSAYLSALTIYRDHASYLREWLEFHRLMGIERFYLYDNGSTDEHLDVLGPYLADGTVTLHEMEFFPPQYAAYRHCIKEHWHESRWIAFIDIDEFLFSPSGLPLPEVLAEYEEAPAVGVNSVVFGTSGQRRRPDGLVIENYIAATGYDRGIKSIADPRRVVDVVTPHHFVHSDGLPVDENHYPVPGPGTNYTSMTRLRINHYHTKSEEELRAKYALLRPDTGKPRPKGEPDRMLSQQAARYGQPEDAILRYVPALRRALGLASRA
jgi:hypothetical protein